jgi:alpha-L-fucosidase
MDAAIVTRLAEVGAMWSPNASRPALPAQGPQNEYPYTPTGATATSGTAANGIDGVNDYGSYTIWQSTASLPQSITIDLGQSRPDVGYVGYVPRYVANSGPSTDGAITQYTIYTSPDNATFTMAAMGTWPVDGKMKAVAFGPVAARYVRLEARAVNGSNGAVATEVTVGARR